MSKEPAFDFVHLPPGVEPESAWVGLHDATIEAVRSDPAACTAELDVRFPYIGGRGGMPEDGRATLRFNRVKALRATRYESPPDPYPKNDKVAQAAWSARSRTVSMDWAEVERLSARGDQIDVYDAGFARADGRFALTLSWCIQDDERESWGDAYFAAEAVDVLLPAGATMSFEEMVELGGQYWDESRKRRGR